MFGQDTKIDVSTALLVYEKVVQYGQRDGEETCLDGIWVSSDFDGYTLFIRDDLVKLTIFFHNKYSVDCGSRKALMNFNDKLEAIQRKQYL